MTLRERFEGALALRKMAAEIPSFIGYGIRQWTEPPPKYELEVDHDYEARRARDRQEAIDLYGEEAMNGELPGIFRNLALHRPMPRQHKSIHAIVRSVDGRREEPFPVEIRIDVERRRIVGGTSGSWIFDNRDDHNVSYAMAMMLTAPLAAVLSPYVITVRAYYRWVEKRHGMSRYGVVLLEALRGQLDAETEALLVEALKNTWVADQAASRQVSLKEAKELLGRCELREWRTSEERAAIWNRGHVSFGYYWFDDRGNNVARGQFCGKREHLIAVLGSDFYGTEADELVTCYRTREMLITGKKEDKSPFRT